MENKLRIEHFFHQHTTSKKATWYHPRFGSAGVLDMALFCFFLKSSSEKNQVRRSHAKFGADVRANAVCRHLLRPQAGSPKACTKVGFALGAQHQEQRGMPASSFTGSPRRSPICNDVSEALKGVADIEETQHRIASGLLPQTISRPNWRTDHSGKTIMRNNSDSFHANDSGHSQNGSRRRPTKNEGRIERFAGVIVPFDAWCPVVEQSS